MVAYVVVGLGFISSAVLLVLALVRGRERPLRPVLWWIGLAVIGIDALLHVPLTIGALVSGGWQITWVLIGTLALGIATALAVMRPRWAGWLLIALAVLLPGLAALGSLLPGGAGDLPWQVMPVLYGVPSMASGVLLVLSASAFGHREVPTAEERRDVPVG